MRQLPATSNSGSAGVTENNRSRSHPCNDSAGSKIMSNGLNKEPIVTRSKSRLRRGRRLVDRSPKKISPPVKRNDADQRDKKEKGTGTTTLPCHHSPSTVSRSSSSSPKTVEEKLYARYYKSYRGLNGVKSRRSERSSDEEQSSPKTLKSRPEINRQNKNSRLNLLKKNSLKKAKGKNGTIKNHIVPNGILSRSPSPARTARSPSTRIRQLIIKKKKQLSSRRLRGHESPVKSPIKSPLKSPLKTLKSPLKSPKTEGKEKVKNHVDTSAREKDKAGKRRSALWVLNCEAESFLFGETAAEKHEVELPPLAPPSPPPKKRRWRANELGQLLEKSPILESKLRKSSSSESGGSDKIRDASPPRKKLKPDHNRAARRVKEKKDDTEETPATAMCSKSVKRRNVAEEEEQQQVLSPVSPKPELLSPIPFLYSPDSIDYEAKAVQFQQMLSNLNWGYAFETTPYYESWFEAYTRTESSIVPYTSFVTTPRETLQLPYEMDKPIKRSRTKPIKNSRKSPRCHASTLAMLSSEKPTRSTRSSVTLETPPSATASISPPESTLQTLLLSPTPVTQATTSAASSSTPTTSKLTSPKNRRRTPSSASPKANANEARKKKELGASQYLWDSVQFLADPYITTLLSGDNPEAVHTGHPNHKHKGNYANHRCNNNNYVNYPGKYLGSERKASLRSGDISNVSVNNSIASSKLVLTPKSSPRFQSSHGTNNQTGNGHHTITSQPASPSSVSNRVQPVNGVTRRFASRSPPVSPSTRNAEKCNNAPRIVNHKSANKGSTTSTTNGKQSAKLTKGSVGDYELIPHEKIEKLNSSLKKTPVVLVSDIITGKAKSNGWDGETLFGSDGLPHLPHWPVFEH